MKSRYLAACVLALLLSGCSWLAPKYQRPAVDLPQSWTAKNQPETHQQKPLKNWWRQYHDPVLPKLIGESLVNNGDLALAVARLQQARAQYDYAVGNQFPLIGAAGLASRTRLDGGNSPILPDKPGHSAFIGGVVSYELDLWGKLASASRAAKATLLAADYNQDAVRLSVAAATAQLYFTLLALDADIEITRDAIRSREESYNLVKKQYDCEAVNGLVLRQSEAELEATRAQLPNLIEQKGKAESSLSILMGRSPREIVEGGVARGSDIGRLPVPPVTPDALPSALLERRPDIAAAEEALIAGNFNIGVARAAYFPTISLSSLLGVADVDIENIYSGTLRTWQMGAGLAGPVFDFGRTTAGVDLATAKNQELLASYKNGVRSAFKEVKDALSAQENSLQQEQAQAQEEKAVREALRLANLRYTAGYSSYIEVLDAERNHYAAQIGLIAAKLKRLNASVDLYKAVGGGWARSERND